MINTLTGMKIDIHRRTFAIANKTGGMSGPAVKPVAVRMVYQTAQAVNIPIIGMGGITNADDALEFILAGARQYLWEQRILQILMQRKKWQKESRII